MFLCPTMVLHCPFSRTGCGAPYRCGSKMMVTFAVFVVVLVVMRDVLLTPPERSTNLFPKLPEESGNNRTTRDTGNNLLFVPSLPFKTEEKQIRALNSSLNGRIFAVMSGQKADIVFRHIRNKTFTVLFFTVPCRFQVIP